MAVFIEEVENSSPIDFVTQASRYVGSDVIRWGEKKLLTFKILKREEVPTSPNDRFAVIEAGQEFRPDIVSVAAFSIPDFWWRILQANNMSDIFDFKAGKTIRIPNNVGF
jgi:hypothetical protein